LLIRLGWVLTLVLVALVVPSVGWMVPSGGNAVPFGMEKATGAWLLDVENGKSASDPRSGVETLSGLLAVNDWVLDADCVESWRRGRKLGEEGYRRLAPVLNCWVPHRSGWLNEGNFGERLLFFLSGTSFFFSLGTARRAAPALA